MRIEFIKNISCYFKHSSLANLKKRYVLIKHVKNRKLQLRLITVHTGITYVKLYQSPIIAYLYTNR